MVGGPSVKMLVSSGCSRKAKTISMKRCGVSSTGDWASCPVTMIPMHQDLEWVVGGEPFNWGHLHVMGQTKEGYKRREKQRLKMAFRVQHSCNAQEAELADKGCSPS